jgi:putative serine protease PepD
VLVAGAGVAGGVTVHLVDGHSTQAAAGSTTVTPVASTTNGSLTSLVAAVKDEVVSVTVTGASGEVEGSGVVVRSDGVIVTNNHVVTGAGSGAAITVTFTSGKTVSATVLSTDSSADLALIQAKGVSGLAAATLGDSGSIQVGDSVVAIGNEYGLSGSVSEGIVSALHRTFTVAAESQGSGTNQQAASSSAGTTYSDAIQTDAAINQGDSGGALFNMSGQLIGITSAIATTGSNSGSVGIGFAIPVNAVKQFVNSTL